MTVSHCYNLELRTLVLNRTTEVTHTHQILIYVEEALILFNVIFITNLQANYHVQIQRATLKT